LSTTLSLIFAAPPIIVAGSGSLVITTALYGFLGGTKEARLRVKGFKAAGSVAVFVFVMWLINLELVKRNPVIEPTSQSWIAIDKNGAPIPVTIGGKEYEQNVTEFLRGAMWSVEGNSELIRARKDSHGLAILDPSSLEHLGLFNRIEMSPDRGIQPVYHLTAGSEEDLSPVYPLKIRATQFKNEYNGFEILNTNNDVVFNQGLLRRRDFQSFEYDGQHYLIFVWGADHTDLDRGPWASFGITQIAPLLKFSE